MYLLMPPPVEATLWRCCVSCFQPAQPLLPWGFSTLGIIFLCPRSSTPFPTSNPDALSRFHHPRCLPALSSALTHPQWEKKGGGALRDSCCLALLLHPLCLPQGETEVETGENTQEDEFGVLTIHGVTRAHAGLYQCTADNGVAPPASAGVQLVVQCEFLAFRMESDTPTLPVRKTQTHFSMC